VRQVELGQSSTWGEANGRLVYVASSPGDVASHLITQLKQN